MLPRSFAFVLVSLFTVSLTGCTVGPNYVRPKIFVPSVFKEQKGWKTAQPQDHLLPGKWWKIFNDPQLDALEEQVNIGNQSIGEAEAQYRLAQHLVQSARSAYFPTATATGTVNRFRAASGQSVAVSGVKYLFGAVLSIAWEPDLWGSVRRQVEANTSSAQASAATLQGLRLSTQATLAQNYFQLRTLDAQQQLLGKTVEAYLKTLEITQNRYAVGVAARSDIVQAETQLESAKAQMIDMGVQRSQMEHALAVLIGKTPAELALRPGELAVTQLPQIPLSVPSELLERRPDIASAERQIVAANAQIGVAKAAYYPSLSLSAANGYQSNTLSTLFTMAHRYWALGPAAAALTLFDGGVRSSQLKQTIDSFDASVAHYRQTVLTGFQEVEDSLAALRILADEAEVQNKAVQAAQAAVTMTDNQYKAGTVSYLNVMTAQAVALNNEQTAVQLLGERLSNSVLLIKALGGGWRNALLPNSEEAAGKNNWRDFLPFPSSIPLPNKKAEMGSVPNLDIK
jgi:NodT family efflux transporter outer membrane factor (OMF) lipoprotein